MNEQIIEDGTVVAFLNGDPDPIDGIVNGSPLLGWDSEAKAVTTYLPMWVPSLRESLYVNVRNVTAVGRLHSVKA